MLKSCHDNQRGRCFLCVEFVKLFILTYISISEYIRLKRIGTNMEGRIFKSNQIFVIKVENDGVFVPWVGFLVAFSTHQVLIWTKWT